MRDEIEEKVWMKLNKLKIEVLRDEEKKNEDLKWKEGSRVVSSAEKEEKEEEKGKKRKKRKVKKKIKKKEVTETWQKKKFRFQHGRQEIKQEKSVSGFKFNYVFIFILRII